jgi:CRISPR-associated protein Cas2
MRQAYVVSYDVCDPKRLRLVFKIMKGYGEHLQLSVFRCELDAREMVELKGKLHEAINHEEDQVLFIDMGPADGRGRASITSLGLPYLGPNDNPVIA